MENSKIYSNPELKFNYKVYSDGRIQNMSNDKFTNPYNDPRRPGECPLVYLPKNDGKRLIMYHDKFMISVFRPEDSDRAVYHLDGDVYNCKIDNLYTGTPTDVLKDVFHSEEEWRPVNIGVRLYYAYYICEDGRLFNSNTGSFVQPFKDPRDGYLRFNLYTGKTSRDVVHFGAARLVAIHFLKKPEDKDVVILKDNDPNNVHVDNLYWGDRYDATSKRVTSDTSREFTSLLDSTLGTEIWKDAYIPGIDVACDYKVSNFGRVWNETKKFYLSISNKRAFSRFGSSYKYVTLEVTKPVRDKNFVPVPVHRLVAYAFCKNDDWINKTDVNHINGNPECNLAINLEWVTPKDNILHALYTNLMHSPRFESYADELNWRLNTILAWIYSKQGISDEDAYDFYNMYYKKYTDNIPKLSFSEFINEYNDRSVSNSDFMRLYRFYKENYGSKD